MEKHGALVLRLALGTMFVAHAGLKYFVYTLPGTVEFFASIRLPASQTRWVSTALVPILLGATWAHAGNGRVFSAPNGGWEYPAFLAAAAAAQALLGDGSFALANALRARKLQRQEVYA